MVNYQQIQTDLKAVIASMKALEGTLPRDPFLLAETHYVLADLGRLGKEIQLYEQRQARTSGG